MGHALTLKAPALLSHFQLRTTRTLLLVSVTFLLLNLPSHVLRLRQLFSVTEGGSTSLQAMLLQEVAQLTYYSTFALNFFLYTMYGRHFQQALRDIANAVHRLVSSCCQSRCWGHAREQDFGDISDVASSVTCCVQHRSHSSASSVGLSAHSRLFPTTCGCFRRQPRFPGLVNPHPFALFAGCGKATKSSSQHHHHHHQQQQQQRGGVTSCNLCYCCFRPRRKPSSRKSQINHSTLLSPQTNMASSHNHATRISPPSPPPSPPPATDLSLRVIGPPPFPPGYNAGGNATTKEASRNLLHQHRLPPSHL